MPSDQERIWRYGNGKWENKEFTATNSGTTITFYFKDSGTDASNDTTKVYTRYFNLGRGANHINLRPSGVVTITQAKLSNGTLITFSDPITVATTGYKRDFAAEIEYLVIETQAASVQVKMEAS
mgnify:CR=1 FL=1